MYGLERTPMFGRRRLTGYELGWDEAGDVMKVKVEELDYEGRRLDLYSPKSPVSFDV